jgi:hypothetical protein
MYEDTGKKITNANIGGGNQSENLTKTLSGWTVKGSLSFEEEPFHNPGIQGCPLGGRQDNRTPSGKKSVPSFKGKRGIKGEKFE